MRYGAIERSKFEIWGRLDSYYATYWDDLNSVSGGRVFLNNGAVFTLTEFSTKD